MNREKHWDRIYRTKAPTEVSWYQPEARLSLELIRRVASGLDASVLDVGGGASTLADGLLSTGYRDVTVLDLAPAALTRAQERLGERAAQVRWIVADVLDAPLPAASCGVWHDRAVFHFLTDAGSCPLRGAGTARRTTRGPRYCGKLRSGWTVAVQRPGGRAVFA